MQLILHVRKFFCTNRDCPRKIFAERLTAFLQPWARLTTRLGQQIEAIGLASCGRLGARLGSRLRIETERPRILRRVMKLATKMTDKVQHLGALPHENLPFFASSISFPPIRYWSLLQARNVAHPLWSRRSTRQTLERKRKILHEATRGRSLSPPHTDRLLRVSKGGERGKVIELSGKTRIAPTGCTSVP